MIKKLGGGGVNQKHTRFHAATEQSMCGGEEVCNLSNVIFGSEQKETAIWPDKNVSRTFSSPGQNNRLEIRKYEIKFLELFFFSAEEYQSKSDRSVLPIDFFLSFGVHKG